MPTALITGVTGQDGFYLSTELSDRHYKIYGLVRSTGAALPKDVHPYEANVEDPGAVRRAIAAIRPDECYHLAAQTFVAGEELATIRVNVNGTLHILDSLRREAPHCRLLITGSSEMFGEADSAPQDETTPLRPRNIYGVSKVAAYHLMRLYRAQYGLYACCAILYNHESPRRPSHFVTRKITSAAARIRAGLESELRLGNLDTVRDWGHAKDFVRGMWLMLQQPRPDDYVLATGEIHSVRQFIELAFEGVGLDWRTFVRVVPEYYRSAEPVPLVGNTQKACEELGWSPSVPFAQIVDEMVQCDLEQALALVGQRG
jgi:GDPmannose 4,6-dehydratase